LKAPKVSAVVAFNLKILTNRLIFLGFGSIVSTTRLMALRTAGLSALNFSVAACLTRSSITACSTSGFSFLYSSAFL
jgi:hypothetical protein